MNMELTSIENGDTSWTVHLRPRVHIEVRAEGATEAQMTAMEQAVEQLNETDLLVHEIGLDDMEVNLRETVANAADGEMRPPDGSELLDDEELGEFRSLEEVMDE